MYIYIYRIGPINSTRKEARIKHTCGNSTGCKRSQQLQIRILCMFHALPHSPPELWHSYPYPCPNKLYKLRAVLFCYTSLFYKLSWAWACV